MSIMDQEKIADYKEIKIALVTDTYKPNKTSDTTIVLLKTSTASTKCNTWYRKCLKFTLFYFSNQSMPILTKTMMYQEL